MPGCSTCGLGVDWLRSCYISKWKLFKDSNVLTRGRYYFAPPDTPMYEGFHNLGSSTWYDRNNGLVQGLGEVINPTRIWSSGTVIATVPENHIVGSADCLAQGESIADAAEPADLIDGFPSACYVRTMANDRLWHVASEFQRCTIQRFYATILDWMYDHNVALAPEAFKELLGDDAPFRFHRGNGILPDVITWTGPDFILVVVYGTRNFQQLALQAFSLVQPPQNFGGFGTAFLWNGAASWILERMQTAGFSGNMRVFFAGHSYGGCAALVLAARLKIANADRVIRYITYGCPKIGDERLSALVRQCDGVNMANDDDIVTVLPPDRITLFPVAIALGQPAFFTWAEWQRPHNQLSLSRFGTIRPNDFPLLDYDTLFRLASNIINHVVIDPIRPHYMEEYLRRIELRCPGPRWPIDKKLSDWLYEEGFDLDYEDFPSVGAELLQVKFEDANWIKPLDLTLEGNILNSRGLQFDSPEKLLSPAELSLEGPNALRPRGDMEFDSGPTVLTLDPNDCLLPEILAGLGVWRFLSHNGEYWFSIGAFDEFVNYKIQVFSDSPAPFDFGIVEDITALCGNLWDGYTWPAVSEGVHGGPGTNPWGSDSGVLIVDTSVVPRNIWFRLIPDGSRAS